MPPALQKAVSWISSAVIEACVHLAVPLVISVILFMAILIPMKIKQLGSAAKGTGVAVGVSKGSMDRKRRILLYVPLFDAWTTLRNMPPQPYANVFLMVVMCLLPFALVSFAVAVAYASGHPIDEVVKGVKNLLLTYAIGIVAQLVFTFVVVLKFVPDLEIAPGIGRGSCATDPMFNSMYQKMNGMLGDMTIETLLTAMGRLSLFKDGDPGATKLLKKLSNVLGKAAKTLNQAA